MNTDENLSELERLLKAIDDRGTPLKMPKQKPHWKQQRKTQQERDRAKRATPYEVEYRKRLQRSLRRKYSETKRLLTKKGHGWDLSFDDWCFAWICCPQVNGAPAWYSTGREKGRVKVERLDTTQPWAKDNFQIVAGKQVLFRAN